MSCGIDCPDYGTSRESVAAARASMKLDTLETAMVDASNGRTLPHRVVIPERCMTSEGGELG